MRLFSLDGVPDENGNVEFTLIPSKDLKNELSRAWMGELTRDVVDAFTAVLEGNSDEPEKVSSTPIFQIRIKIGEDRKLYVEEQPLEFLDDFLDNLSKEGEREYEEMHEQVMNVVSTMLGTFFQKVSQLK